MNVILTIGDVGETELMSHHQTFSSLRLLINICPVNHIFTYLLDYLTKMYNLVIRY